MNKSGYKTLINQLLPIILLLKTISATFVPTFNGYELTDISEYGCWCRFDKNMARHGEPIDAMDKLCFTYFKNVQCLIGDELVPEEFDVYSVDYKIVNNFAVTDRSEIKDLCVSENPESTEAEIAVCTLHATFTYDMFMHFFTGTAIDNDLKTEFGFDFDSSCVKPLSTTVWTKLDSQIDSSLVGKNVVESDLTENLRNKTSRGNINRGAILPKTACCGDYPNRFPYKPDNSRGCCLGKTYNTDLWMCCEDGTVKVEC